MRDIARRLFGREVGRLFDMFEPEDPLGERVRESGEWCQSTPGHAAAGRVGFAGRARSQAGRRRGPGAGSWCERM